MSTNDELNEQVQKEIQDKWNAMTAEEREQFAKKLSESVNNLAKAVVKNADAIWDHYTKPGDENEINE